VRHQALWFFAAAAVWLLFGISAWAPPLPAPSRVQPPVIAPPSRSDQMVIPQLPPTFGLQYQGAVTKKRHAAPHHSSPSDHQ
jgi:hypothetical protein